MLPGNTVRLSAACGFLPAWQPPGSRPPSSRLHLNSLSLFGACESPARTLSPIKTHRKSSSRPEPRILPFSRVSPAFTTHSSRPLPVQHECTRALHPVDFPGHLAGETAHNLPHPPPASSSVDHGQETVQRFRRAALAPHRPCRRRASEASPSKVVLRADSQQSRADRGAAGRARKVPVGHSAF